MSTTYLEQMRLSIIYMHLLDDIADIAEVSFSPEHKQRMLQVISDSISEAINVWVARCEKCDRGIQLICTECEEETTR